MARLKPLPRTQRRLIGRELNRGTQLTRKTDSPKGDPVKDISIGLMDVDAAIMYYFEKVIKPQVVENEETIKVPILYANPERWKSIQKDGFLRDVKNQLILPLIIFRRISVSKDDAMAVDKLDANDPKLFYTFERKYTQENRYDQFSVLTGIKPSNEYYSVAMPDYMNMNYECVIWTAYTEQMNRVVEKINWSDGSYWGEPGKFKFKVNIDSFEDATELSDAERIIKTNFNFSFRGYLIPESFNNYINTQKSFSPKGIVITDESGLNLVQMVSPNKGVQKIHIVGGQSSTPKSLGSATDFIRGAAVESGQETQDLEFTNIYGGETLYIMRNDGEPTSSKDTVAVLNLGFGNIQYFNKSAYYSGSQSSSVFPITSNYEDASGSVFSPTLSSGTKFKTGSVSVQWNGIDLTSTTDQKTSGSVDFYLSSSLKDIIISRQEAPWVSSGSGLFLDLDDDLLINYQQEKP